MSSTSVYLGVWINHSVGRVLGTTLTIPGKYGVLLTNFLALFVSWTGIQVWNIFCYCIHIAQSSSDSRDIFHYQRQALLRNGLSEFSLFWRIFKVAWGQAIPRRKQTLRRSTPVAIFALFHAALFATAGIFSSKVTNTNSEALVRSTSGSCGQPDFQDLDILTAEADLVTKANALYIIGNWALERSRDYANSCYNLAGFNYTAAACDSYIQPRLQSIVNLTDACPFKEGCIAPAITVRSGYLDSDLDVGVNAQPSQRIQFEKILTCAPLDADSYASNWTTTAPPKLFPWDPDDLPDAYYKYYYFGNQTFYGINTDYTFVEGNFTAAISSAYTTDIRTSLINDSRSSFNPIPALNRTDADVSLWNLRNKALYTGPVNDPWYKATTPQDFGFTNFWTADSAVSTLGCIEQYVFCNELNCTTPGALSQFTPDIVSKELGYNAMQLATFNLMWRSLWIMNMVTLVFQLQDYTLLAKSQVWGQYKVSSALPDNQWQLEVGNIFNISLALLQILTVINADPPQVQVSPNTTYSQYITPPNVPEAQRLCLNQKITSSNVASFNLFGVLLIVIGGSFLILLSNVLPNIVEREQRKSSDPQALHRRNEWNTNDVLHLQKIAMDGYGIGPWICEDGQVPILKNDNVVARHFRLPWLNGAEHLGGSFSHRTSEEPNPFKDNSQIELLPVRAMF